MELNEGDFEIGEGGEHIYGRAAGVFVERVSPGAPGWRVQDSLNPVGDNRHFGRDYLSPPTWTLKLGTNGHTADESLDALAALARVWNKPIRSPGAETVLRYKINGRTRRLYGRARGLFHDPNRTLRQGYVPVNASFDTSDTLHYDDAARSVTLGLVSPSSGGVTFPVRFPIRFASSGERIGLVDAHGDANTPVVATVNGPCSDPSVSIGGHALVFAGSLAYDQSATVDTRTKTITQAGGANLRLSRKSYLSNAVLPPGVSEIIFRGVDATGTATCRVTWHDAHHGF